MTGATLADTNRIELVINALGEQRIKARTNKKGRSVRQAFNVLEDLAIMRADHVPEPEVIERLDKYLADFPV